MGHPHQYEIDLLMIRISGFDFSNMKSWGRAGDFGVEPDAAGNLKIEIFEVSNIFISNCINWCYHIFVIFLAHSDCPGIT